MAKYWKLVGVVLAVAKPDQGDGTQLFTLVDSVELPARTSMTYEFVQM